MTPLISLRNIEKYFEHGPTRTYVLRRVNLDVQDGEFISIMGPSGAGKSTLLHLLGMHVRAVGGVERHGEILDGVCWRGAHPQRSLG